MSSADLAPNPAPASPSPHRRRPGHRFGRDPGTVGVLVLPFLILFVAFYLLPIGYAVWQSLFALTRSGPFKPSESTFVGLANYAQVLADPVFGQSLINVALYGIGPSALTVLLGLVIALVIDGRPNRWVARFSRAAVFAPYAVRPSSAPPSGASSTPPRPARWSARPGRSAGRSTRSKAPWCGRWATSRSGPMSASTR